jgi:glycosyltransferase involved in cell wall biosynthesis
MKHLLFLYVGLPLGGIETLLVRLAEGLARRGVRVSVLLATRRGAPELRTRLHAAARVGYLDEINPDAARWMPDAPLVRMSLPLDGDRLRAWLGGTPSACHVADTGSLLLALRLAEATDIGPLTIGVYHDGEYLYEDPLARGIGRDAARVFREAPADNLVFFNEASIRAHAARYGLDASLLRCCPIGVDLSRFSGALAGRPGQRIVSIGRLTPFKTYNRVMLDVVERARANGIALQWEVWGNGELRPWLEQQIAFRDLGSLVSLKGELRYDEMEKALSGTLAFVGSGTALVEASAAGVPAIAAIENETGETTYGCLHDFAGLSYHDAGLALPQTTISRRIEQLRTASPEAYAAECSAAQNRARDFSLELTLDRFEALVDARAYRPRAAATRALHWLAEISAVKAMERAGRRSRFIHRHSAP